MREYIICKELGWTLTELYNQPNETVAKFEQIINLKKAIKNATRKQQ